jgi:hypothetical protein
VRYHVRLVAVWRRLTVLVVFLLAHPVAAEWAVEGHFGTAWNVPSTLKLRQDGQPELRLDAHWSTQPLRAGPYYAYRIVWWRGDAGWELQELHHKIYLNDPPPEVQDFQISHGYNLISLARAWRRRPWTARLGAGVVLARPHSRVRGLDGPDEGEGVATYFWTGPALHAGIGARLGDAVTLLPELRLTVARAHVPIARGDADAPNFALHFQIGVGLRLKR